jgi:hypothetical protein
VEVLFGPHDVAFEIDAGGRRRPSEAVPVLPLETLAERVGLVAGTEGDHPADLLRGDGDRAGVIMAQGSLVAAGAAGTAFAALDSVGAAEDPRDGNGVINSGELARFVVSVSNFGIASAIEVSASRYSTTRG